MPDVLHRPRLIKLLSGSQQHPAIWVSSPPGAGKTTLVTQFLDSHDQYSIWLQLNSNDADPASFFHQLSKAAQAANPNKEIRLPRFTMEYMFGLPTFAINYFQALFGLFKHATVLALDNYQEIGDESPVHQCLSSAIEQLHNDDQIIFISRSDPPDSFARLQANQLLVNLTWQDIQFNEQETLEFLSSKGVQADKQHKVMETAQGWAAGLILMLRSGAAIEEFGSDKNRETIFAYFAGEIFRHEQEHIQQLLLVSSLFPSFTVRMLASISTLSESEVENTLARLVANNFFTELHKKTSSSYQYHPLFRGFLYSEFRKYFNTDDAKHHENTAAQLLIEDQQIYAAADLLITTKNFDALTALCLQSAPALLQSGENGLLIKWVSALPGNFIIENPWLSFYFATALSLFEPSKARELFKQAIEQFKQHQSLNTKGIYSCWSGAAETFNFEWDKMWPIDGWLDEYRALQSLSPEFPSAELEGRALEGLLSSINFRPQHLAAFPDLPERSRNLLHEIPDINQRVGLGAALMFHYIVFGGCKADVEHVRNFISPLLSENTIWVSVQLRWLYMDALLDLMMGDLQLSRERVNKAFELIDKTGVHIIDIQFIGSVAGIALATRDIVTAETNIKKLEQLVMPQRLLDVSYYFFLNGWLKLTKKDYIDAEKHFNQSIKHAEKLGTPFAEACSEFGLFVTHVSAGSLEPAEQCHDKLTNIADLTHSQSVKSNAMFAGALLSLLRKNYDRCRQQLIEALDHSSRYDVIAYPFVIGNVAFKPLYEYALKHQINIERTQQLIRAQYIQPDDITSRLPNWPWPVHIKTFGDLEIWKDGVKLEENTKNQRRPITLLSLLVSENKKKIPIATVIHSLWPDSEGDKAESNFKMALSRLRKLIGKETVLQKDNYLFIDENRCRIDAWVLNDISSAKCLTYEEAIDQLSVLSDIYTAEYFVDGEMFWDIEQRKKSRELYLKTVLTCCEFLLRGKHYRDVEHHTRLALQCHPEAEDICLCLMQALTAMDKPNEIKTVYSELTQHLATKTNTKPSEKISQYYESTQAIENGN